MIPAPFPFAMLATLIDHVNDQFGEKDTEMVYDFLADNDQTNNIYLSNEKRREAKDHIRAWQKAPNPKQRKDAAAALADWVMEQNRAWMLKKPGKYAAPLRLIRRARAAARLHQVATETETHATEAFLIRCVQELTEAAYESTPQED